MRWPSGLAAHPPAEVAGVKVRGRLSFQDAAARRTAERHVEALVAAGVAPDAVRVEGLTLVVAAEAPDDPALRASLRALAAAAWGGSLSCEVPTSAVPEVLYAGGPDASGVRPLGSLLPVVHASRFRGELARAGTRGDPAQYRFDRRDCAVLVVYALSASADKPDGDDPRWVYGTPPEGVGLMAAQPAPTARFMRRPEFFQALNDAIADERLEPWAAVHLGEGLGWAAETGCRWFAYMLEPFTIAGDGRAVSLANSAEEEASAPLPVPAAVGTADTIAASPVGPQRPSQPQPPAAELPVQPAHVYPPVYTSTVPQPVAPPRASAPSGPAAAWSETPSAGYQGRTASGAHRGALLRALSRNIGENGLVVARRAAGYAQQCGALSDALLELLAITNDPMGTPATRGDALFAVAVLGVEQRISLPDVAFAPLLDATLRSMTMDADRRPGFEGLLALAPRTAAYQALRASLGLA
ncbi:MAG: hypothetical protein IPL19_10745 [Sandaracinaceae bacterium]|nr:hypothetical protein [Sandaracinaceae bacterium]